MKLISMNLQKMTDKEVVEFADKNGFESKDFIENKEMGVVDMWVVINKGYKVVAYTLNTNPTEIKYVERNMPNFLKTMFTSYDAESDDIARITRKSMSVVSSTVDKLQIILETDAILDKISKNGISSLSKEEKDFLKKQ
jgi:hypothetical protein